MGQEIKLVFDIETGETQVEAQGFKGSSCKDATKFLESLGNKTDFQRKREWFETNLASTMTGTLMTNLCG